MATCVDIESASLIAGTSTLQEDGLLRPLPMTIGYEGAGVGEEAERGVMRVEPNDQVSILPTLVGGAFDRAAVAGANDPKSKTLSAVAAGA